MIFMRSQYALKRLGKYIAHGGGGEARPNMNHLIEGTDLLPGEIGRWRR